jgi:hypothetical protein
VEFEGVFKLVLELFSTQRFPGPHFIRLGPQEVKNANKLITKIIFFILNEL